MINIACANILAQVERGISNPFTWLQTKGMSFSSCCSTHWTHSSGDSGGIGLRVGLLASAARE